MSVVEVRPAKADDLDAMARVFQNCYGAPPWNEAWTLEAARERLEAMLLGKHFRGLVACCASEMVGVLLGQKERWIERFHFNLQELCVLPSRQRSGIGRALVERLRADLRREDTERIYLITAAAGGPADFYDKLGFQRSRGRILMASPSTTHDRA